MIAVDHIDNSYCEIQKIMNTININIFWNVIALQENSMLGGKKLKCKH